MIHVLSIEILDQKTKPNQYTGANGGISASHYNLIPGRVDTEMEFEAYTARPQSKRQNTSIQCWETN